MTKFEKILQRTGWDIEMLITRNREVYGKADIPDEPYIKKEGIRHYTDTRSWVISYAPKRRPKVHVYIGNWTGVKAYLKTYGITVKSRKRKKW